MHPVFVAAGQNADSIPIFFVNAQSWSAVRLALGAPGLTFADATGFEPKPGRHAVLPGADGGVAGVLFATEADDDTFANPFLPGALPGLLPAATYRFAHGPKNARLAALAFALGSYRFGRYGKTAEKAVRLVTPTGVDGEDISRIAEGVFLARDLINTPANDMGPEALEAAARQLAARHGGRVDCVAGGELLTQNFPLIHAVGRAAAQA